MSGASCHAVNTHLIRVQLPYATLSGELTFQCPLHVTINRRAKTRFFAQFLHRFLYTLSLRNMLSHTRKRRRTIHIFNIIDKQNSSDD